MNRYLLPALAALIVNSACSVQQPTLPSSMAFHGTLMMDVYPIRVFEYREFLSQQPPDSRRMLVPSDEGARFYLNDKRNLQQPVRGINAQQALAYCKWRSHVWNRRGDGNRYRFRLPTVAEMRESPHTFGAGILDRELATAHEGVVAYGHGFEAPDTATAKGSIVGFRCMAEIVPF